MKKVLQKYSHRIVAAIILVTMVIGWGMWTSRTVEAAWFDDNFLYRQKIALTNSSGTIQTDFQILLTVDTATFITAGKMQSNCNDIRVIDPNGKVLPYWLEPNTCNTSTTKVWTKVPSIPTSASYVYIYYGNPAASSASSPTKTFIREISDVYGAWDLDEAGTGTRADSSGNTNTLTNNNGVTNTTGLFSNAGQFTAASNQYLSRTDNASLSSGNIDLTLAAWVYLDSKSNDREIIGKFGGASNGEYFLRYDAGLDRFRFVWYTDGAGTLGAVSANTLGSPSTGTWYFIVASHNATTNQLSISVNSGTPTLTSSVTGGNDSTANFQIGSFTGVASRNMDGRVDGVRVYKRVVSGPEIANLYGAGTDRQGYVTTNYPNKELIRKYNTSVSAGSPSTEEKAPQPVAYWKFDEGTGQTTKDSTTNGNSGTLGANSSSASDDPTWLTEDMCVSGKCLKFDGSNDVISIANNKAFNITSNISIGGWIKLTAQPSTNTEAAIFSYRAASSGYALQYSDVSGTKKLQFVRAGAGNDYVNYTLSNNTWYHIAATSNTTTTTFYVNGVSVGSTASGSWTSPTSGTGAIGRYATSTAGFFTGFIDEIKVYPYSRSAAQIKTDYNSRANSEGSSVQGVSSQALSNGLIGYWKMDEASWNGTTGEIIDASGNAANGTAACTGASCTKATTAAGKFGNAGSFGGSSEGPNVNIPVQMIDGTNPTFSYSLWVKATNTGNTTQDLLAQARGGTNNNSSYEIKYAIGTKNIGITDGGGSTINNYSYDLSSWTHLTVTNDYLNNAYRLYINGSLVKTGTAATLPVQTLGAQFKIGNHPYYPYGLGFSGSIDEVRVYNRVLSGLEAQQLANFAPGPVARYNFEEGNGSTVNDTSGNGNNGTWSGAGSHWTTGKIGKAGSFNGTDDAVTVTSPANGLLDFNATQNFTVGTWFYSGIQSGAARRILSKRATGTSAGYDMSVSSSGLTLSSSIADGSNQASSTGITITNNTWYHVSMVVDRSTQLLHFYVNGKLQNSTSTSSVGSLVTASNFFIGKPNAASATLFFWGNIDDVRIYNYARTQKQIIADMSEGGTNISTGVQGAQTGRPATPVGYWKFDEGNGTVANNNGSCGNGCNGTLTSMASPATSTSGWTQSGKFGKALVLDGTNDYINVGTNISNLQPTGNFTITSWFKTSVGTQRQIFSSYSQNSNVAGIIFGINADGSATSKLGLLSARNTGTLANTDYKLSYSTSNVDDGAWHFGVGIYDGTNLKIYVDGKLQTTTAWTNAPGYAATTYIHIGNHQTNGSTQTSYFNGSIDEVKVYNYALSSEEIKQEYNRGSAQVIGAVSTASNGTTPSNGDDRRYCVPGDTSTCSAPTSEWNFEEGTGTVVKDTSGNALNGTLGGTGTQRWTSGKIGKGGKFNGTDDYVTAGSGSSLLLTQLTISGWVKTSTVSKGILGKYDNHNYWRFRYYLNSSGQVVFNLGRDNTWTTNATSTIVITDNKWHYISGTYDTVNIKLYIDGKLEATVAETRALNSGSDSSGLCIGTDRFDCITSLGNGFFNGSIDNVRIFNYARTPAQIAWDYNQGDPVAHYKFDECQGSVAGDSSGNGNNGTVTIGASGTQTTVGNCTDGSSASARYNGVSGKRNYSLNFDGTDDFVNIPTINHNIGTGDFTFSAWVNPTALSGYKAVMASGMWSPGLYARLSAGNFGFFFGADRPSGSALTTGTWQHIVGLRQSGTIKYYLNGVQTSQTYSVSTSISNAGIGVGSSRNDIAYEQLNGKIDDVRIYNYALTPLQVKTLMNDGAYRMGTTSGAP